MATATIEEMLAPFVDTEDGRYGLGRQWVIGGWRAATDSRIAVRVKTGEADFVHLDEEGRPLRFPDVASVFDAFRSEFENTSMFSDLVLKSCAKCGNKGRIEERCGECFLGEAECDKCGHVHKCEDCDGTGKQQVPCSECENLVVSKTFEIDVMYLYRIEKLPGVRILHIPKKKLSLFTFESDGVLGQGMVMHRRRE